MRITRNVREYTAGERQFLLYKFLLTHASKNGVIDNAAKVYKK